MDGLMMDYDLTLYPLFERVGQYFPKTEIVSRWPDKSIHRSTYGEFYKRVQKFANALTRMGLRPGDRVATLAWNHGRHLEAYFAIPLAGGVIHTLNPRLSPQDLTYIMNHAEDRFLVVDDVLVPIYERFHKDVNPHEVIVWTHGRAAPDWLTDYEQLIEPEMPSFAFPRLSEGQAAGICYTSGTTGRPKGVVYSHRALVLHSLACAIPDALGLSQSDVMMPVVPMFHVNAWGLPFTSTMVGAKQVFPGPHLDAASLLELIEREKVTFTAGVPTVWLGILEALDKNPSGWDTSSLKVMVVGGAAAPEAMIEAFEKRHRLQVVHAWGMTEMTPVGTVSRLKPDLLGAPERERFRLRASQGVPLPLVETRVVGEGGPAPWDGTSMGELQVRGPWVAKSYFQNPAEADKFTMDGWFRTGDIVSVHPEGYVRITDRLKDLIKSGGEWISSVDLENALMGHPAVKEAAVVAVSHPHWGERPVACVVLKQGSTATPQELRDYLAPRFARYWLPDGFVFLEQIPRTATGKFLKSALRDQLRDHRWEEMGS
ncbi:MAG TPA: long-chain fatty acid--CoA ligase [Anaeromyxobacteraceae bacterium]|nr:long-chain fatty acid--CoA ligase [Anaeromyxobacteraceae bacterium]